MDELKVKIVQIFIDNQKDLEGYSYYGQAWGVSEDDYDDVAQLIIDEVKKLGELQ